MTDHMTAPSETTRFREASLRGLEGTIRDMETTETEPHQAKQIMAANTAVEDIESVVMCQLEGLEAEIQDIIQDSSAETGGLDSMSGDLVTSTAATKSHDHATMAADTSAARSHDQATMSHDQSTTSHDQATTSHDQASRSHDHTTTSHDQVLATSPSSKAISRGTQFPSATDVYKTEDDRGALDNQ